MKSTLQKLLNIRSIIFFVCGLLMSGVAISQTPTATQVAADMGVAWNLGNTLEPACGEGCWAPAVTPELIDAVAAAGFKTIRIPVAWDSHADNSYQIDPTWLARVKEVVDYCYANNLYVLINNHYDNGWFANNGFKSFDSNLNAKFEAYWTQIANTFVNYDSHLLFCAANEPHVETASETDVLLQYYQTFVDAVRATGGQNTTRCLVLSGPRTNIQDTYDWMNTLPTDPTSDRLMAEVHYYDPYQFALMEQDESWGNTFYYWGQGYHSTVNTDRNANWGEEDWVEGQFDLMQTKFVNNGIPVILGEFGAIKRSGIPEESLHIASREYFHNYVTVSAQNHGLVPVYWDNGWAGENGFALFDRNTAAVVDQGTIDALTGGGNGNAAPTASYTWSATDLAVNFDGSGSSDSDGSISSWAWDFGDSNTGSGQTASHTYAASGSYTVTLTVTDDEGATDTESQVVSVSDGSSGGGTGTILREYWTGISGTDVSNLTSDVNYPDNPTGSEQLTLLEGPTDWNDNYGTRIRGYIHPTTSGSYTFWVAGDDDTDLYLSTDDNPANASRIAYIDGWTNSREWTKYSTQQSVVISLTAGQKYYIEVLHKESGGGDNVAVAWQGPGITQSVIGGTFLSPYVPSGGTNQYSLSTSVSGSGSVSLDPLASGGLYDEGTVVTVTANPDAGCQFDSWSGDLSGSTNPTTITMNSNKSVTATFTSEGGGATTAHVQWIVTETQNVGKGNKRGVATVNIQDNLGNGVSSATVTGTFSGTFNETVTGTTDSNGNVTLITTVTAKGGVSVDLCVDDMTHGSLTYDQAQNVITCTGAGARISAGQSDDLKDQSNFALYPNPSADGKFFIDIPLDGGATSIRIFNVQGKLVHNQISTSVNKVEVNSELNSGVYIIRIHSASINVSRKLVIK